MKSQFDSCSDPWAWRERRKPKADAKTLVAIMDLLSNPQTEWIFKALGEVMSRGIRDAVREKGVMWRARKGVMNGEHG